MKKTILTIVMILLLVAVVTASTLLFLFPYQPDLPPEADDTGSTTLGVQDVVNANNQFAFDLYSQIIDSDNGNVFYSPYSISAAMAMTVEGANGQTADEINSVFHFPDVNTLRTNFAAIYNDLNQNNNEYELRTGNALWTQHDFPFLDDYMNTVEQYYGGKASDLDFKTQTEKSRQTINDFIEQQTNGKIKDLIEKGLLTPLTKLVLTNAIYFKGTWEWEFDKSDTREQNFYVSDDNVVKTQMMHMDPDKARFKYAQTDNLQILELPYKGDKISMLILLPTDDLTSIEQTLTLDKLNEYKTQMQDTKLSSISIPKFEFDTKFSLNKVLSELGMPTAFTYDADFSGMNGLDDLYISFVLHQAYIKVDEKGTEAAAATAIGISQEAAIMSNIFRADHPFIFIIQENDTGNILFMGRVTDPTQ